MSITKKIRFEVFKRDSFTCQYCGRIAPNIILEVDHIHPKADGGTDDILNLITSCFDCNRGKSDKKLSDNAEINKKMNQLKILNEKKQQLDMLYEYQKELLNIEDDATNKIDNIFHELTSYTFNDIGKSKVKTYIKKYGFTEVVDVLKISISQYGKINLEDNTYEKESIELSINKLPLILNNRKKCTEKPYMTDLYYIRGILKNRYVIREKTIDYYNSIHLLEKFYKLGLSIDDIKDLAIECNKYWELEELLEEFKTKGDYNG